MEIGRFQFQIIKPAAMVARIAKTLPGYYFFEKLIGLRTKLVSEQLKYRASKYC